MALSWSGTRLMLVCIMVLVTYVSPRFIRKTRQACVVLGHPCNSDFQCRPMCENYEAGICDAQTNACFPDESGGGPFRINPNPDPKPDPKPDPNPDPKPDPTPDPTPEDKPKPEFPTKTNV